jgi:hypothetical protein
VEIKLQGTFNLVRPPRLVDQSPKILARLQSASVFPTRVTQSDRIDRRQDQGDNLCTRAPTVAHTSSGNLTSRVINILVSKAVALTGGLVVALSVARAEFERRLPSNQVVASPVSFASEAAESEVAP